MIGSYLANQIKTDSITLIKNAPLTPPRLLLNAEPSPAQKTPLERDVRELILGMIFRDRPHREHSDPEWCINTSAVT